MLKYIDLARAKSEAIFNIYSFLQENIKSRKKRQGENNENGEENNNNIDLISKKTTFHVQQTARAAHFLTVVLHDQNVKLLLTSYFHVLWRKCFCSCFNKVYESTASTFVIRIISDKRKSDGVAGWRLIVVP